MADRQSMILAAAVLLLATVSHSEAHASQTGQSGIASFYSYSFQNRRTASGQRLNPHAFSAAHRSLPFGTRVKVLNQRNGRSIVVTINDRGPFVRGRIIDLTPAGAQSLGMSGLAPVTLQVVQSD